MTMITCSRCNGLGKHSFNTVDGDVCYGCWGKGKVPDKKTQAVINKEQFAKLTSAITTAIAANPGIERIIIPDRGELCDIADRRRKALSTYLAKQGITLHDIGMSVKYLRIDIRYAA